MTFPTKKEGYTVELKGEVSYHKSGRDAKYYNFKATISAGTIFQGIRNMEELKRFSKIYEHPHEEIHNDLEERTIYLKDLIYKLEKLIEENEFYKRRIQKYNLETVIEKEKGIITIRRLQ